MKQILHLEFSRCRCLTPKHKDYTELINWSSDKRADPPMFRSFQSTQLEESIHTSDMLQLKSFPCLTQTVERGIKLATEARAALPCVNPSVTVSVVHEKHHCQP